MAQAKPLLTAEEEQEVIAAIKTAEQHTSGEIRVHIEATTPTAPFRRAQQWFHHLNMDATAQQNGVLIYLAVNDRKFVMYGGRGIDEAVPDDFWERTKDAMATHFKKGAFAQGLVAGILRAGKELKAHFPRDENDTNELSDAISKG